jgi:hypothetical protein
MKCQGIEIAAEKGLSSGEDEDGHFHLGQLIYQMHALFQRHFLSRLVAGIHVTVLAGQVAVRCQIPHHDRPLLGREPEQIRR